MLPEKNHFGIFTLIKKIITKFLWAAIAVLFGVAVILSVNNHFSFLPEFNLHDYSPPIIDVPDDNIIDIPDDNSQSELPPEEDAITAESYISSVPLFDDSLKNLGYTVSDNPFGGGFMLAKIEADINLPLYYSVSEIVRDIKRGDEIITEAYPRPALHPRMGFILLQNSDLSFTLLDSNGSFICDLPADAELLPARDSLGNPVFSFSDGYKYYSREEKAFLPSPYNPEMDIHGVVFDSPSYYDVPKEPVYRAHSGTKGSWGFKHVDERQIVSGIYDFAYQFSQGFGAVKNKNGRLTIHNSNGYSRFTDHSFYMPDDNGINSLGFYTFDHGLMRVRDMKYDWTGKLLSEREFVLHLGNTEFHMPDDYKIESYFDGVFLLSKDGRYGYYNYLGEWIVQPIYTYAVPFVEGLGVIGYADGKKGVVDENGTFVVPMVFDEISRFSGGVMSLYSEKSGWHILNKVYSDTPLPPDKPTENIPEQTPEITIGLLNNLSSSIPYSTSYIAERASYDYTMWLYNNEAQNEVIEESNEPSIVHTFAPYAPSYFAEQASYDYTMWLYNNETQSEVIEEVKEPSIVYAFAPYAPSYFAEQASYDYTMWLYNNETQSGVIEEVKEPSVVHTFAPYVPSYFVEKASYDYTMWLYNTKMQTEVIEESKEPSIVHTFAPYVPSYFVEKASYDYTM